MKFLNDLGLGDGLGNTSSMRVVFLLTFLAILIPKVVTAIKTGVAPQFTPSEMEVMGIAFGAKLIQNVQENKPTDPAKP